MNKITSAVFNIQLQFRGMMHLLNGVNRRIRNLKKKKKKAAMLAVRVDICTESTGCVCAVPQNTCFRKQLLEQQTMGQF